MKITIFILALLAVPLAAATWCGSGCSLDQPINIGYAFLTSVGLILALRIYIIVLTIQENNDRARRRAGRQTLG